MAKDRKAKALKVPKRVAGIKVPKKVRKTANRALAVAENPQARELALAALTAAAAALGKKGVDAAKEEGGDSRAPDFADVREQAARLSDVVIAAALEGARRLLDGVELRGSGGEQDGKPAARPKRARPSAARAKAAAGPADA